MLDMKPLFDPKRLGFDLSIVKSHASMVLFDYGYVQVRLGGYMAMVRGTARGVHDYGTGYG